jgi:hypothetical protein
MMAAKKNPKRSIQANANTMFFTVAEEKNWTALCFILLLVVAKLTILRSATTAKWMNRHPESAGANGRK